MLCYATKKKSKNTIDYYAEEITKKEYEEGLGLFWDEMEVHNHETQSAADDEEEDLLARIAELSDENATLNANECDLPNFSLLQKTICLSTYGQQSKKTKGAFSNTQRICWTYIFRS